VLLVEKFIASPTKQLKQKLEKHKKTYLPLPFFDPFS
jgi:hypothetical protein